jgi:hypothetical protein
LTRRFRVAEVTATEAKPIVAALRPARPRVMARMAAEAIDRRE